MGRRSDLSHEEAKADPGRYPEVVRKLPPEAEKLGKPEYVFWKSPNPLLYLILGCVGCVVGLVILLFLLMFPNPNRGNLPHAGAVACILVGLFGFYFLFFFKGRGVVILEGGFVRIRNNVSDVYPWDQVRTTKLVVEPIYRNGVRVGTATWHEVILEGKKKLKFMQGDYPGAAMLVKIIHGKANALKRATDEETGDFKFT
jgi:hypothetical protein